MSADSLDALRRDYESLLRRIEANQSDFRKLARSAFRLQEDERRRIARELHDGIGQNLTALKHLLGLIGQTVPPGDTPAHALVERALDICNGTLEDTRQMARLLRPQVLDDLGLVDALHWLGRTLTNSTGLEITLQLDDEPEMDEELQTVVFRVAQEASTNAVRHAGARRLRIGLRERAGHLLVEIADDGKGLDGAGAEAAQQGVGLSGMRERVEWFGGRMQLLRSEWGGLLVRALLPLDANPVPPPE